MNILCNVLLPVSISFEAHLKRNSSLDDERGRGGVIKWMDWRGLKLRGLEIVLWGSEENGKLKKSVHDFSFGGEKHFLITWRNFQSVGQGKIQQIYFPLSEV